MELIQYFDADHNEWIDIAKIDEDKNGGDGAVLRVNLLSDATIPDPISVSQWDLFKIHLYNRSNYGPSLRTSIRSRWLSHSSTINGDGRSTPVG